MSKDNLTKDNLTIGTFDPTGHVIDTFFHTDLRDAATDLCVNPWEDDAVSLGDRAAAYLFEEIDTFAAGTIAAKYAKVYLEMVSWERVGQHLLDNYNEAHAERVYRNAHG